jgi:hypothetical protein
MDPCTFSNGKNPISNKSCNETFVSLKPQGLVSQAQEVKLPKDPLAQLYFFSLAGVGIYVLYKIMEKSK